MTTVRRSPLQPFIACALPLGAAAIAVVAAWGDGSTTSRAPTWALMSGAVAAACGCAGTQRCAARPQPGFAPLVLLGSCAAITVCVPEISDQMAAVIALTAAVGAVELVLRRATSAPVLAVLTAVVVWGGLYGAAGRDSAYVGACVALLPAVLAGAARRDPRRAGLLAVIGAVTALVVARTGALRPTIGPSLVAAAVAAMVGVVAALTLGDHRASARSTGTVSP